MLREIIVLHPGHLCGGKGLQVEEDSVVCLRLIAIPQGFQILYCSQQRCGASFALCNSHSPHWRPMDTAKCYLLWVPCCVIWTGHSFWSSACILHDEMLRKTECNRRLWETSGVCRFQLILLWEAKWNEQEAQHWETVTFSKKFPHAHGHSLYLNNSNYTSFWLELLVYVLILLGVWPQWSSKP